MANGSKRLGQLNDLRGPMDEKLSEIHEQLAELAKYKAIFGSLDASDASESGDTEREDAGSWSTDDSDKDEEEDA